MTSGARVSKTLTFAGQRLVGGKVTGLAPCPPQVLLRVSERRHESLSLLRSSLGSVSKTTQGWDVRGMTSVYRRKACSWCQCQCQCHDMGVYGLQASTRSCVTPGQWLVWDVSSGVLTVSEAVNGR